jgi:hypothetical protein
MDVLLRLARPLKPVAAAAGVALAGAVLWGLVALLLRKQFPLLGLGIGVGVGYAVARLRPRHTPTAVAGAVVAVAGCALGTLLAMVFVLLDDRVGLAAIVGHAGAVLGDYPRAVGVIGAVFWLAAAAAAVVIPRRGRPSAAPAERA